MIDEKIKTYPDVYKMMKTCKLKDFKQECENLLFDIFSELYQTMNSAGHIPEEVYSRLNFPSDTNYDGDEVSKPDGISQEARHRANIVSHSLQCSLRRRNKEEAAYQIMKKKDDEKISSSSHHKTNDKAMKELF